LFAKYFKLINGYIKSIGEKKEENFLNEDETAYNGNTSDLDNFLTNDSLTNDQ
jgi:hypothetical protein